MNVDELLCVCVVFQTLVNNNRLSDSVFVIAGKIEEIDVPEKVDVIISEPMGYMLFNERMLETFLHAKKWLKPGGIYHDNDLSLLDSSICSRMPSVNPSG